MRHNIIMSKKIILLILIILLSINFINANFGISNPIIPKLDSQVTSTESLGTFKRSDIIILSQTCDNCTYINVSRVKYPNSSESYINSGMSETLKGNWNLSFTDTGKLGKYLITTCGNPDGIFTCENYDFKITTRGQEINLFNIILVIAFFILAIIIFFIGNTFKSEQYIIKTSFYIISIIFGLLGMNSARIIASESLELDTMASAGLILTISIFLIMFLYVFIYWSIQTFKSLKQKEGVRWQY